MEVHAGAPELEAASVDPAIIIATVATETRITNVANAVLIVVCLTSTQPTRPSRFELVSPRTLGDK